MIRRAVRGLVATLLSGIALGTTSVVSRAQQPGDTVRRVVPADPARADFARADSARADAARVGADSAKAPGDTAKALVQNSTLISPIPLYSPESGWGGGAGFVLVRMPDNAAPLQRPTTYQGSIVGTETGQFTILLIADRWLAGNSWRLTAEGTYQRAPSKFFGIGPASDNAPEKYTPTSTRLILTAQKRVAPKLFVGLRWFVEKTALSDIKAGPILAGTVPGARGWSLSTLSLLTSYDSRDRYYTPRRGIFATLQLTRGDNAFGSEYNFWRTLMDFRFYRAISGEHILAFQLWGDATFGGTTAFDRMPRLGGKDNLRGFFAARYRDQFAVALQGEYRSAPWRRLSGTLFAATGSVASKPGEFYAPYFRAAAGVGVRWAITGPDRLNLRVDRAWGPNSAATYFTIGEAF